MATSPSRRRPRPNISIWEAHRATQLRIALFAYLGGECCQCGSTDDLQPNHIYGRNWQPCRISRYRRALRYWREARQGREANQPGLVLINLLCGNCNAVYKPVPLPTIEELAANPF